MSDRNLRMLAQFRAWADRLATLSTEAAPIFRSDPMLTWWTRSLRVAWARMTQGASPPRFQVFHLRCNYLISINNKKWFGAPGRSSRV